MFSFRVVVRRIYNLRFTYCVQSTRDFHDINALENSMTEKAKKGNKSLSLYIECDVSFNSLYRYLCFTWNILYCYHSINHRLIFSDVQSYRMQQIIFNRSFTFFSP